MNWFRNRREIQERVERGARRMDERYPDWHLEINLSSLDIGNGDDCLVGQLDGVYHLRSERVGLESHTQAAHEGFETEPSYPGTAKKEYSLLTKEWKGQIRKRAPAWSLRRLVRI